MPSVVKTWENDRRFVNRREVYERRSRLRPELPLIGRQTIIRAVPQALRADAHRGEYELHLVQDGQLQVWVDDPKMVHSVPGGSASLTQPGQRHGGVGDLLYPGRWYWLRFRVDSIPAAAGKPHEWKSLLGELEKCPFQFPFSPSLADTVERLMAEHRHRTPESPMVVGAMLVELLAWIVRDCRASRSSDANPDAMPISEPIAKAIAWIDQNYAEDLSISDLAEGACMSESHFRRTFHAQVGCSPSDYLMRRRIESAKELLGQSTRSITKLAFELGFSSSAYFTSVFHKQTGLTPTEYRRSQQPENASEAG